jgi:hypothetical protein
MNISSHTVRNHISKVGEEYLSLHVVEACSLVEVRSLRSKTRINTVLPSARGESGDAHANLEILIPR